VLDEVRRGIGGAEDIDEEAKPVTSEPAAAAQGKD